MKDTLLKILFSTRLTAVLFILFPTAMALGTFIETWYSTDTAKIWIYNAWWFELFMALMMLNFIGNIFKYKLLRKSKWAVLLLHLSFVLILLGAFVTRYFGYEGVMPIREGETTDRYLTEKTYLTVFVDGEKDGTPMRKILQDDVLFSEHVSNKLSWKDDFAGIPFEIDLMSFQEDMTSGLVMDPEGERYLKIVEASDGSRHEHHLKEGEVANIHNILFTLNNPIAGAINIRAEQGEYFIQSPFEVGFMRMADQYQGRLEASVEAPLQLRSLYTIPGLQFVIPEPLIRGRFDVVPVAEGQEGATDALGLQIQSGSDLKTITLLGAKGAPSEIQKIEVNGLDFYLQFGSLEQKLPFSLTLNDFIAEKYPGTEKSYASFMSKIQVEDQDSFAYDIYMNHVLDHRGYRFFQASFDPDEKGTVLSINHDWWGTWITYVGYFLLYLSMIGIFFIGKTRFVDLAKSLEKLKKQKTLGVALFLFGFQSLWAQDFMSGPQRGLDFDSLVQAEAFAPQHASKFGRMVIQDLGGRMKPANTFSSELLRKVSKRDTYKGLNSDQVLLSILNNPAVWYNIPIIYLKRGNDSIRKTIGVAPKAKYASLVSFFDAEGNYKIAPQLEKAYRARVPNSFEKDFIEVDKRVNLLYSALEGRVLRIFPLVDDANNRWVSYPELKEANFTGMDSLYVRNVLPLYLRSLRNATEDGDYEQADNLLASLKGFQQKYGAEVLPSDNKIAAEIAYNEYNIFEKLFQYYLYVGLLLFVIVVIQIFKSNRILRYSNIVFQALLGLLFLTHTLGLGARWFISGHAPWSDAYESMIYVAWATQLFGFLFGRKSALTLASTAFVSSMILMIAHWNWTDPAIANLQPVLDSYWLMIHVAVIVGSYGPFALSMIIGVVAMLLMLLVRDSNKRKLKLQIKELTIINELSLTVGLVMLTIGNFLGGMWANESWGRYWGWDPKETWALISILVYAFVLHMRLIPGLGGRWTFNFMSVVAFASILMTYFGVNFYLVGLHSYASGDKIITPDFVYYAAAFVLLLGGVSYWRNLKFK